jgi:hypothetical protein
MGRLGLGADADSVRGILAATLRALSTTCSNSDHMLMGRLGLGADADSVRDLIARATCTLVSFHQAAHTVRNTDERSCLNAEIMLPPFVRLSISPQLPGPPLRPTKRPKKRVRPHSWDSYIRVRCFPASVPRPSLVCGNSTTGCMSNANDPGVSAIAAADVTFAPPLPVAPSNVGFWRSARYSPVLTFQGRWVNP